MSKKMFNCIQNIFFKETSEIYPRFATYIYKCSKYRCNLEEVLIIHISSLCAFVLFLKPRLG